MGSHSLITSFQTSLLSRSEIAKARWSKTFQIFAKIKVKSGRKSDLTIYFPSQRINQTRIWSGSFCGKFLNSSKSSSMCWLLTARFLSSSKTWDVLCFNCANHSCLKTSGVPSTPRTTFSSLGFESIVQTALSFSPRYPRSSLWMSSR